MQMVKAGLKAIYLSGWQVAADANLAGRHYPDQSLYPANSAPALVKRINSALLRADQIAHAEGDDSIALARPDRRRRRGRVRRPAQRLRAHEVLHRGGRRSRPFRGPARPPRRSAATSAARCSCRRRSTSAPSSRPASPPTCCDVPTLVVARTDALAAKLLTSDVDERDAEFCTGERTPEGLLPGSRRARCGDRPRPRLRAVRRPRSGARPRHPTSPRPRSSRRRSTSGTPGKLLAYNCSPSFNWRRHLSDGQIAAFQRELAASATASSSSRSPASTPSTSRCSSSPADTATRR